VDVEPHFLLLRERGVDGIRERADKSFLIRGFERTKRRQVSADQRMSLTGGFRDNKMRYERRRF
jgi:hypothetical protein